MNRRPTRPVTAEQALIRLETLCASSEQCTADLLRRLSRWGVSGDDSERIISRLRELRFVDDSRFARAYVRDKYRFARWGRMRIIMGLRAANISRDTIDDALAEIDEEEYEAILTALLRAKARSARLTDSYADRSKLFRFAASRGFESSLASRIISRRLPWIPEDGSEE